MTLLSIATAIREAWDALFVSRHTLFLEAENSRLRAQVAKLGIDLSNTRLPIQTAPANKEDLSKIPQRAQGFQFWDADIRAVKRKEMFEEAQETADVQS